MNKNIGSFRQRLKRLTSKKGSVLFFVIAIMSVLIVMASALFYAVNSARQEVEAKYSNEQAYQSAIAINDIIADYVGKNVADSNNQFIEAITSLTVGNELSLTDTNGSEFAELAGSGLGKVKITVKKLSADTAKKSSVFSITTESDVNGERQVITSIGELTIETAAGKQEVATFDRFFTGTGYTPYDINLSFGHVVTTLFLDNEYAKLGLFEINADVVCSGSLELGELNSSSASAEVSKAGNGAGMNALKRQLEINVDKDLYNTNIGVMKMAGTNDEGVFQKGIVRVGEDFAAPGLTFEDNIMVYVLGDFYADSNSQNNPNTDIFVKGDMYMGAFRTDGDVYVDGDLFINSGFNTAINGTIHVGGNIYCLSTGTARAAADGKHVTIYGGVSDKFDVNGYVMEYSGLEPKYSPGNDWSDGESYFAEVQIKGEQIRQQLRDGGNAAMVDGPKVTVWEDYVNSLHEAGTWTNEELPSDVSNNILGSLGQPAPVYSEWALEDVFHDGGNKNNPLTEDAKININHKYMITEGWVHEDDHKVMTISAETDGAKMPVVPGSSMSAPSEDNKVMILENIDMLGGWDRGLIIDTANSKATDGYSNLYIRLNPNCVLTKDASGNNSFDASESRRAEFNCFNWACFNSDTGSTPYQVLIKGKGCVVFVVPEGCEYVTPGQSFVGHIGAYTATHNDLGDEITINDTIDQAVAKLKTRITTLEKRFADDQGFPRGMATAGSDANLVPLLNEDYLYVDEVIDVFSDPANFNGGTPYYIHNNVFIVDSQKNGEFDITSGGAFTGGFIYAPYQRLNANNGNDNPGILGGLIVGDYAIQASGVYICTLPYDYYDIMHDTYPIENGVDPIQDTDPEKDKKIEEREQARRDLMSHLLAQTNNNKADSSQIKTTNRAWKRMGYN